MARDIVGSQLHDCHLYSRHSYVEDVCVSSLKWMCVDVLCIQLCVCFRTEEKDGPISKSVTDALTAHVCPVQL